MCSTWTNERLKKLQAHYERLLHKALSADIEERRRLFTITRISRKRLRRLGIIVRDMPGGKAKLYIRTQTNPASTDDEHSYVKEVVRYIKHNNLIYGRHATTISWAISLNSYRLPDTIADYLSHVVPEVISEYISTSSRLIDRALNMPEDKTSEMLLYGIPRVVKQLWREYIIRYPQLPYCIRPDLIIDSTGTVRAVEFNIDSRLDRGIALGVSRYSTNLIKSQGEQLLANNFTQLYAKIARDLAGTNTPIVATTYNPKYRIEYAKQEEFFCKAIAENENIDWKVLPITQLTIDASSGFLIDSNTGHQINVINLELELLNGDGTPRQDECNFVEAILIKCPRTKILGNILPYADKLLLSLVGGSLATSSQLREFLMPTWPLTEALHSNHFITLKKLRECSSHIYHFVLKRAGVHSDSTGSKGVFICSDITTDIWQRSVDQALSEMQSGQRAWVVQSRAEPKTYRVLYRLKPFGRTREADCFIRLSAYYTLDKLASNQQITLPSYLLVGAVATAGTDQETVKKHLYTIRALRQSTYMAVTKLTERPTV